MKFGVEMHQKWERILDPGRAVRVRTDASPWIRQNAARVLATLPASGDEIEPLLGQVGLTTAATATGADRGA